MTGKTSKDSPISKIEEEIQSLQHSCIELGDKIKRVDDEKQRLEEFQRQLPELKKKIKELESQLAKKRQKKNWKTLEMRQLTFLRLSLR